MKIKKKKKSLYTMKLTKKEIAAFKSLFFSGLSRGVIDDLGLDNVEAALDEVDVDRPYYTFNGPDKLRVAQRWS